MIETNSQQGAKETMIVADVNNTDHVSRLKQYISLLSKLSFIAQRTTARGNNDSTKTSKPTFQNFYGAIELKAQYAISDATKK
jgi:hypothetical protein